MAVMVLAVVAVGWWWWLQTDGQTDKRADRQTETETERQRESRKGWKREREGGLEGEIETVRQRRETETDRQRQRERQTDRQTGRERQTGRDREREVDRQRDSCFPSGYMVFFHPVIWGYCSLVLATAGGSDDGEGRTKRTLTVFLLTYQPACGGGGGSYGCDGVGGRGRGVLVVVTDRRTD